MSRRWHLFAVLCALVAVGAVACSSDPTPATDAGTLPEEDAGLPPEDAGQADAGSPCDAGVYNPATGTCVVDPGIEPTSLADFETKFRLSWCAYLDRCNLTVRDPSLCVAAMVAQGPEFNNFEMNLALAKDQKSTYDEKAGTRCLEAMEELRCSDRLKSQLSLPACQAVFSGPKSEFGTCTADAECQKGSFCLQTVSGTTPTCAGVCRPRGTACATDLDCGATEVCSIAKLCAGAPVPPGEVNQPCGTNDRCSQAVQPLGCFADSVSGTKTCKRLQREGLPCDLQRRCAEGYFCVDLLEGAGTAPVPTCVRPLPVSEGDPCDSFDPLSCKAGLTCVFHSADLQQAVCRPPKKVGDSCTAMYECSGMYGATMCDVAQGKCVTRPSSGTCPFSDGRSLPLGCDPAVSFCAQDGESQEQQQCTLFRAAGEECANDHECGPWYREPRCAFDSSLNKKVCAATPPVAACE